MSGIPETLAELGAEIETTSLPAGDYAVGADLLVERNQQQVAEIIAGLDEADDAGQWQTRDLGRTARARWVQTGYVRDGT